MFCSTNAVIQRSSQELAYEAGIPLSGASLFMVHVFGKGNHIYADKAGCYQTDQLSEAEVYLKSSSDAFDYFDKDTTNLLGNHQAHHYFNDIARRIWKHGGVSELRFPDGKKEYARLAHHYSHLGVSTTDGVCVPNISNLYATGDATGNLYWTGYGIRLPGVALTATLLSAKKIAEKIGEKANNASGENCSITDNNPPAYVACNTFKPEEQKIRRINTKHLLNTTFGDNALAACEQWHEDLEGLDNKKGTLLALSQKTVDAIMYSQGDHAEPYTFSSNYSI